MPPFDHLTVLTSTQRKLATKRIVAPQNGPIVIEDYPCGSTFFSITEVPVSNFDDLAAVLGELQTQPYRFVVRGRPLDGIDRQRAKRRLRARKDGPATFEPAARHWIALDFDSVPCPAGIDLLFEPDRVVEHVVELLPAEFQGVSCFWHFTSGHGLKAGIRIRVWYLADRPLDDWELKTWLHSSPIDLSLFSAVQPHYIAAPLFLGMHDPVPFRFGTWTGHSDAVTPPVIEKPQERAASTDGLAGLCGGYLAHRARIGDHERGSGFYGPLKGAIGAFFKENGAVGDAAWLRADLADAIRSAPRDPAKHDDSYVEHRVVDLDPWIEWTREREEEKAEKAETEAEPIDPTYPPPIGSVAEARAVLATTMQSFALAAHGYREEVAWLKAEAGADPPDLPLPPVTGVEVAVGLGKTRAFREDVAVPLAGDGLPVTLAVPLHKLGDEVVGDLATDGVTARVYRGRDRPDPDAPGELMCRDLERSEAVSDALGDIARHACKRGEHVCEFYDVCGYRGQRQTKPDVWLVAHQMLFNQRPSFIPGPAALGIDETFWGAAVHGVAGERPRWLPLAALIGDRHIPLAGKIGSVANTADLVDISRCVFDAIIAVQDGRLRRQALIGAGLTAEALNNARRLEWMRKLDLDDVLPGMPREAAVRACKRVAVHNKKVAALARFWELLARTVEGEFDRSPWINFMYNVPLDDDIEPAVRLSWRDEIHPSWSAPTVVMDAMLPVEIVREFLSQMGEPVRAAATMPHTRVRQITDRPMSLAMFIETDSAGERRNASRHNNVERLRRLIEVRAYDARPGTILVVCQEAVEIALGDDLPDNVSTVHFNALKGMNTWSDATVVMVVGRTEPSPADVEGIARALFGAEVAEVEPDEKGHIRYPRVVRGIRMRDGTGRPVEGNHHPDARGEAVRWGICEAELVQAIGRGRGVNRTAENVLQIDILTNIALPGIEVDEVTTWDAIQPGMIDVMRARGAAPLGYVDMAAGHPDLFSGAEGDWPRKPRIFVY